MATKTSTKRFCLGGDLNVNLEKQSHFKDILENWSIEYDLSQLIKTHTWERLIKSGEKHVLKKSKLDLIFSNTTEITAQVLDKYTSDHCVILVTTENHSPTIQRTTLKRRDYRTYSSLRISEKFTSNLQNQSLTSDPDFDVDTINESMTQALDELYPFRSIRVSRPTDIVDQALEKMKKKRKRLLKKFNKKYSDKLAKKINYLNILIKNKIVDSKKQQMKIKMDGNNPRRF